MAVNHIASANDAHLIRIRLLRAGVSAGALIVAGIPGIAAAQAAVTAAPAGVAASGTGQAGQPQSEASEDDVIVVGQRAAIQSAQTIKRRSDEIVDSIVADDIGKLPDRSVTEALQRVVGVTIDHTMARGDPEHFSVEGSGVNIRGLSYVRSELNGRDSFTANGGRSLSFEDVPPELMAGVDVYKNPSAEQIEGAIGGLVNLRTAMPFDYPGLKISASGQGSWGDLSRGRFAPSASVLISDRWETGIGEIGVLFDFAYSRSKTRTDAIQQEPFYPRTDLVAGKTVWVPKGISWRTLAFDRTRKGFYGALQWRPAHNLEFSATYFRSDYNMHWDENAIFTQTNAYNIFPAAGTQFTYDSNNVFQKGVLTDAADGGMPFNDDVRSADRHSVTDDLSWHAKWEASSQLSVTADLQYVHSTTDGFDSTVATGLQIPSETVDRSGPIPTLSVDKAYMTNPANYYWAFTMDHMDHSVGKEWAGRIDADYSFGDGFLKSLRIGGRYADRSATTNNSPYNWQAVSQTWQLGWYIPTLAYLNTFQAPSQTYAFPNFFNGKVQLPSAVVFPATSLATGWPGTYQQLAGFRQTLCKQLDPNCVYTFTPTAYGDGTLNDQREQVYSGYASLRFGSELGAMPLTGVLGVRVVRTEDKANGVFTVQGYDPAGGTLPPGKTPGDYAKIPATVQHVSVENNYTYVLPSLNAKLQLTPKLQARFAFAKAIARPDFSQLQAFTTLSSTVDTTTTIQNFTGTGSGNPNLRPVKSTQLDATLEWYFAPAGSLTFAAFYKNLSDVVINQIYQVNVPDSAGAAHPFIVNAPVNGARGKVKGLEIAYNQYFDFLPGVLRGVGFQGNFTYVDAGKQKLYTPVTGTYCTTSVGTAANLNLNLNGCDTNAQSFNDLPLANLSKYSFNAALLYDRGPVSARLAYNWRSKYLQAINVNPTQGTDALDTNPASPTYNQKTIAWGLPIWADNYGQLDGSLFLKVNKYVTVGVEAQNLLDSEYRQLQQQHIGMMGRAWFVTGRRYTFNLRVSY